METAVDVVSDETGTSRVKCDETKRLRKLLCLSLPSGAAEVDR